MTRFLAVLAALALVVAVAPADEKKEPTIKQIMTKAHKGGDSLLAKMDTQLKASSPEWSDVQKESKELVELGTSLGKAKPKKGAQESWEKLTASYLDTARELNAAAEKKDADAATQDLRKLKNSCKECHTAHK